MYAHPRIRGPSNSCTLLISTATWSFTVPEVMKRALSLAFPENILNNHPPTRSLTPATPKPHLGQPKPRAIKGGRASGIEEAEKNDIEREFCFGESVGDGRRMLVETATFSGMDKNEGIPYLHKLKYKILAHQKLLGKKT